MERKMVYSPLYVIVVAFFNWAADKNVVPGNMDIDKLYRAVVEKLIEQYNNMNGEVDYIKWVHEFGKQACYTNTPWGFSDIANEGIRTEFFTYSKQASEQLKKKRISRFCLTESREWWRLFVRNFDIHVDPHAAK
jgi:hypothetical protein